jgi:hypothetical protein
MDFHPRHMPLTGLRRPLLASLLSVLSCGTEGIPAPPQGFGQAVATNDCGPADGPAVAIYLAQAEVETFEPAPPYVRIYVAQPLEELAGRSWSLAGHEAQGSALYCNERGTCEAAIAGTLTVDAVTSDSTVDASTTLAFPSSGRVIGGIRARWVPRTMLCG